MKGKLDYTIIQETVGGLTGFERRMVESQCETEEHAIRTIKNYRKDNKDYAELMRDVEKSKRRDKYTRTHYNDREDDIEENYEKQNYLSRTRGTKTIR